MTDSMNSTSPETTLDLEAGSRSEVLPRLFLEICRGRTEFPQRPVVGPRFFIGSGSRCDLRLGGSEFPALHSLIHVRDHGIWFETLAETPVARLNGVAVTGEWLNDGDALEIGDFQFVAHIAPILPPLESSALQEFPEDPASLSAEELVDRLAAEIHLVNADREQRQAGAESLLEAVRRQQRELRKHGDHHSKTLRPAAWPNAVAGHAETAAASREFHADLDHLTHDLQEFTQLIEQHTSSMTQREVTFAATAEMLLAAQQQLVNQLEATLQRVLDVGEKQAEPATSTQRASA